MTRTQLNSILESQVTALVLLGADLCVRYMNPAAQALLGTSGSQVEGEHVDTLFTVAEMPQEKLLAALDNEQSITNRDAAVMVRQGQLLNLDYTVTPITDTAELLLELQETDKRMRYVRDDQSQDAQFTNRHVIQGLAHEVKNPLGGIRGAAQLLEQELSDPLLKEYTQVVIEEADRLTALVDRMLGPIKKPDIRQLSVHEVLERVLQISAVEFNQIDFIRDYDPSLPDVCYDKDQLVQAILNIVRNAGQALAETPQPTITVRTRIARNISVGAAQHRIAVRVDVIDNGPGVPDELGNSIFYPMVSGRAEGTGVGLSITQTIISQHAGSLEMESRPGYTCFSVTLPLEINK